jgi:hypothetical protein
VVIPSPASLFFLSRCCPNRRLHASFLLVALAFRWESIPVPLCGRVVAIVVLPQPQFNSLFSCRSALVNSVNTPAFDQQSPRALGYLFSISLRTPTIRVAVPPDRSSSRCSGSYCDFVIRFVSQNHAPDAPFPELFQCFLPLLTAHEPHALWVSL